MAWYIDINIWNDTTSQYLTLNATDASWSNLFLNDTSYTIAPGMQQMVAQNCAVPGSVTYNIDENSLLNVSWKFTGNTINGEGTCAASVQGTTEYTASGFDSATVMTVNNNKIWSFIIKVTTT